MERMYTPEEAIKIILDGNWSDVDLESSDSEDEQIGEVDANANLPPKTDSNYTTLPNEDEFFTEDERSASSENISGNPSNNLQDPVLPTPEAKRKPPKLLRGNNISWVPVRDDFHLNCTNFSFNKKHNITYGCDKPINYFQLFCSNEILKNFMEQSNLYSAQKTAQSIGTTINEIKKILGINIMSGIVKMPSYRMYWARDTRYPCGCNEQKSF